MKGRNGRIQTVTVKLLQSVYVLPHQSLTVNIQLLSQSTFSNTDKDPVHIKADTHLKENTGVMMEDAILSPTEDGLAQTVIPNPTRFTQVVEEGTEIGTGMLATVVERAVGSSDAKTPSTVSQVSTSKPSAQR